MRALGWIEDQNFVVEWRSAEDKPELLPGLAAELVHLKSDLIVAAGAVASQTDAAHLERVITEVARLKAEALIVRADPIFVANREQIAALALKHALPTIAEGGRFVSAGCLASYAPHYLEVGRGIATLVDQIFRGANPGDLPIRQPTKFELSFNLKTAKALGVAIPQTLLVRADEVIQ